MQMRCLLVVALSAGSALAESPVKLDCTIRYWNEPFKKEKEHDYQHGYSTTKVAPKDIAWLRPGITSSIELRNLIIRLSKLASDHGANAMSYDKSGTEIRFCFLRLEDAILAAAKRGKGSTATPPGVPFVVPISR